MSNTPEFDPALVAAVHEQAGALLNAPGFKNAKPETQRMILAVALRDLARAHRIELGQMLRGLSALAQNKALAEPPARPQEGAPALPTEGDAG